MPEADLQERWLGIVRRLVPPGATRDMLEAVKVSDSDDLTEGYLICTDVARVPSEPVLCSRCHRPLFRSLVVSKTLTVICIPCVATTLRDNDGCGRG